MREAAGFYWRWMRVAFRGALDRTALVAFVILSGIDAAKRVYPDLHRVTDSFIWAVPFWVLATVMVWRVIAAPFIMWREDRAAIAVAAPQAAPVPPMRRLTPAEKSSITKCAIGYVQTGEAPNHLMVMQDNSSRKAMRCAEDIIGAFQAANWNVSHGGGTGHPIYPPTGIGLAFADYGELAPDQRCVKDALEAASIPFDIIPRDHLMELARTIIFVTEPD
jgi:hypothetical protein